MNWMHEPGDLAPADSARPHAAISEFSRDIRSGYEYNNLCFNVAGLLHRTPQQTKPMRSSFARS